MSSEPLKNMRWEKFCQLYAGECFGYANKAYVKAGYKTKDDHVARSMGYKLLTNADIWNRIQKLRAEGMRSLAIDAKRIMELRLQIAYDKEEQAATRISALKDVERALGLEQPEKHDIEMKCVTTIIQFVD